MQSKIFHFAIVTSVTVLLAGLFFIETASACWPFARTWVDCADPCMMGVPGYVTPCRPFGGLFASCLRHYDIGCCPSPMICCDPCSQPCDSCSGGFAAQGFNDSCGCQSSSGGYERPGSLDVGTPSGTGYGSVTPADQTSTGAPVKPFPPKSPLKPTQPKTITTEPSSGSPSGSVPAFGGGNRIPLDPKTGGIIPSYQETDANAGPSMSGPPVSGPSMTDGSNAVPEQLINSEDSPYGTSGYNTLPYSGASTESGIMSIPQNQDIGKQSPTFGTVPEEKAPATKPQPNSIYMGPAGIPANGTTVPPVGTPSTGTPANGIPSTGMPSTGTTTTPANPAGVPAGNQGSTMLNLGSGVISLAVPENARVYINGYETKIAGSNRTYVLKNLVAGNLYTYQVRVVAELNGRHYDDTKQVTLSAGQNYPLAFSPSGALPSGSANDVYVAARPLQ